MQISERTSGTVTIVDLSGVLNLGPATERLHDKINSLLQQERKQIILNLRDVTSVDSGGLGELVRTHTSAKGRGGAVKIVNLPKRIQDLLVMTRLVTVFDTFDNENDAVKSFGG
jgi:anti-sigma B factor antagonist